MYIQYFNWSNPTKVYELVDVKLQSFVLGQLTVTVYDEDDIYTQELSLGQCYQVKFNPKEEKLLELMDELLRTNNVEYNDRVTPTRYSKLERLHTISNFTSEILVPNTENEFGPKNIELELISFDKQTVKGRLVRLDDLHLEIVVEEKGKRHTRHLYSYGWNELNRVHILDSKIRIKANKLYSSSIYTPEPTKVDHFVHGVNVSILAGINNPDKYFTNLPPKAVVVLGLLAVDYILELQS